MAAIVAGIAPDVIVLQGIDYDLDNRALSALQSRIADAGHDLPYVFAARPNTGVQTPFDLNRDGRFGGPTDAQSYGLFAGQGGLAVLARYPVTLAMDHSELLWADAPGAAPPEGYYTEDELQVLRLSTVAHWELDVALPSGPLRLMTWAGSTPVFDGPEDRNGKRGRDELLFWESRIAEMGDAPFALLGKTNIDPVDGDGIHGAINAILSHPRLQDPGPTSAGGERAAAASHAGDPALDTVDWPEETPGNLRVSIILPHSNAQVLRSGVFWPEHGAPGSDLLGDDGFAAGPHRLVWVDLIP